MTVQIASTRPSPVQLAADVVSAYVARNAVPVHELPSLIESIYLALYLPNADAGAPKPSTALVPPVSIKKSIQPDQLVCLECGMHFRSLKRHLLAQHQIGPDAYRSRWSLRFDYPMVAPNYSKQRSQLAKSGGLGKHSARKGR